MGTSPPSGGFSLAFPGAQFFVCEVVAPCYHSALGEAGVFIHRDGPLALSDFHQWFKEAVPQWLQKAYTIALERAQRAVQMDQVTQGGRTTPCSPQGLTKSLTQSHRGLFPRATYPSSVLTPQMGCRKELMRSQRALTFRSSFPVWDGSFPYKLSCVCCLCPAS